MCELERTDHILATDSIRLNSATQFGALTLADHRDTIPRTLIVDDLSQR
jgi:hypothetical protein